MGLLPLRASSDADGVKALADEFTDLRAKDAFRIERMKQYRAESDVARSQSLMDKVNDPLVTDYNARTRRGQAETYRHNIPLPFAKAINVKHAFHIAGKLPDVIVDRRDESPPERYRSETMEKIVWAIMRASRGQTQFASAAWDGSELGASCFDIYFDVKRQIPIIRSVDPIGLVVIPGVDDPHDFQGSYRTWDVPLMSLLRDYDGKTLEDGTPIRLSDVKADYNTSGVDMVSIAQFVGPDRSVRFLPGSAVKLWEHVHNYGFTPYVVIPNIGPERDIWGWADYEFVRAIGAYMSALFSREADILRAVANGTYLDKGTGQNPDVVKRALADGGVIPSKSTGSLEPVDVAQVPGFASEHSARAMEMFKMLGFMPDAAWGVGSLRSASAGNLLLQPTLEYSAMKQMNWEAGLGRLFGMAYRMLEGKLVGTGTYRGSTPSVGNRRLSFNFQLGSDLPPLQQSVPSGDDALGGVDTVDLPRTPAELFDGDYDVRFVWENRVDPDDPAYVLSELNKFEHGAQSLETTLERLGYEAPQDEIRRIEKEAELYPWLNNGMIALIRAQLSAGNQGDGGGQPPDPTADLSGATTTALDGHGGQHPADAAVQGLGAGATGQIYGGQ